jgi:hypothetical protein
VIDLTQKQKREYSKTELVFGNLAILIWILLGTVTFWMYFSFGAIIFLALMFFLVFYELGKKGCVSCFLCKTCTIGMGKLPDFFFTKTTIENLNINRKALKLFPFVYILLGVIPISLTVVTILQYYNIYSIVVLAALTAFSVLTGTLRRKMLVNL